MPTYVFLCEEGHKFDKVLRISSYNDPQVCKCGAEARRITVPTMVAPDMQHSDSYVSPATGKVINSYRQRREDMARAGCVDYDPGLKDENTRNAKKAEIALEKNVDSTVDRVISEMPAVKREKLISELSAGASIEYGRH